MTRHRDKSYYKLQKEMLQNVNQIKDGITYKKIELVDKCK